MRYLLVSKRELIEKKKRNYSLGVDIDTIIQEEYGGLGVFLQDGLVEQGEIFAVSYVDVRFSLLKKKKKEILETILFHVKTG